jgi:hypothetical protein
MGSLVDATEGFVLLDGLKELARSLAADIDVCDDAKDKASLARQYRETMKTIDEIEGGIDSDDDIAAIIIRNRKSAAD